MPTAAKLTAAVVFAALGYGMSLLTALHLPQAEGQAIFRLICAILGGYAGWIVAGVLAGRGYAPAIGGGMRAAITMAFFALLLFSGREMIVRSLQHAYRGPAQAIDGMFGLIGGYMRVLIYPDMLLALLLGGAIGGLVVEWVARRWS